MHRAALNAWVYLDNRAVCAVDLKMLFPIGKVQSCPGGTAQQSASAVTISGESQDILKYRQCGTTWLLPSYESTVCRWKFHLERRGFAAE